MVLLWVKPITKDYIMNPTLDKESVPLYVLFVASIQIVSLIVSLERARTPECHGLVPWSLSG